MQTDKKQFLQDKIKENLYEFFAKDFNNARDSEIYIAIAKTLRLIIGKDWYESLAETRKEKTLYILSFEYSLGTRLVSNATKLELINDIKDIVFENGRDFNKIKDQELESALGFGDLGIISSNILDSLASLGQNVHAYGLRYRKGMLKQEIIDGQQIEKPDDWEVYKNPWEHEKGFAHEVKFKDYKLKAVPYDVPIVGNKNFHVNTLRLWKSESVEDIDFQLFSQGKIQDSYKYINRANSVVEFLYPQEDSYEGRKLRLTQEVFFASASIQDILRRYEKYHGNDIGIFTDKVAIQINDLHPAISMLVFIDILMKDFEIAIEEAVDICRETFTFLNISLVEEAFEKWELSLIQELYQDLIPIIKYLDKRLRHDLQVQGMNQVDIDKLAIIKDAYIEMINLVFYLAREILVPTDQQVKVIREIYFPLHYQCYKGKISLIKLGHNAFDSLEEVNTDLYDKLKFINFDDANYRNDLLLVYIEDFKDIKTKNKEKLVKFLENSGQMVNPKSIFDMNLGVFHEYKRQLLGAFGVAYLYYRIKQNGNIDIPERTYFFGGKSYPNYYFAKEVIKFINALAKLINNDYTIRDKIKIIFIEDYNIAKSNLLIPAADVYEHLDVITKGAASIDSYKFMANGAAIISSDVGFMSDFKKLASSNSLYIFGAKENDAIARTLKIDNNIYDYLNEHKIIKDMFTFYRYQPYPSFPYDINIIVDNLLRYNDGYNVIRDLIDYVEVHERLMSTYRSQEVWTRMIKDNMHYAMNNKMNDALLKKIGN